MAGMIEKFNIPTMWFFLFGGPGEDEDTFRETLDFIDHFINPGDLVYMNAGLRIYPKTPLYDIAVKEGRLKPGQSVYQPAAYYFSDKISKGHLDQLIKEASAVRYNCLPSADTTPPPEMIAAANELRKRIPTQEPMFRTLLKIRKIWMEEGKI